MCKTTTIDHSCSCPPSKDWSPCPAVHEGKECTGEEEAHEKVEETCKECQAEAKLMEESLQKIAEDEKLAPVPKSNAAARSENQGPKQHFVEVMRWEKCNHISHPTQTSIERDPLDPPYIETPGRGLCWSCAKAHASTLKTMKENGTYNQDDPWGAMTQDPNADVPVAGPSGLQQKPISHRAMAMGLDDRGLAEFDALQKAKAEMMMMMKEGGARKHGDGPPPSHERTPEVVGKGKGKGRDGDPKDTYEKRYGAVDPFVDSDDDDDKYDSDPVGDDDDEVEEQPSVGKMPPRAMSAQHPARNQALKSSRHNAEEEGEESEEDGGSEEEEESRAPPPTWSSKPSSSPSSRSNFPIPGPPTTNGHLHRNDSPSHINHNKKVDSPSDHDSEVEESSSEPDETPTQKPLRPHQSRPQQPTARMSNRARAAIGPIEGAIPTSSSSSGSGGKKRPSTQHPPAYEPPEEDDEEEEEEEEEEEDSDDYGRGKGKGGREGRR